MANLKPFLIKKKVLKCNITEFKGRTNSNAKLSDLNELKLFEMKLNAFSEELRILFQ